MSTHDIERHLDAINNPSRYARRENDVSGVIPSGTFSSHDAILRLQRAAGNAAVNRLIGSDEQPDEARSAVLDVLVSSGRPLEAGPRAVMEERLGHDFSDVRVHTGAQADESARSINALAFTVGSDIVFGSGHYTPDTLDGQRVLAHELTHVVQQKAGPVDGTPVPGGVRLSDPSDCFERAAEEAASQVTPCHPSGLPLMGRKNAFSPSPDDGASNQLDLTVQRQGDAGASFNPIGPGDVYSPSPESVPNVDENPSPSTTNFALQVQGAISGGEYIVLEVYKIEIFDLDNHLTQTFAYTAAGLGGGTPYSVTPFGGERIPFSTPKRASLFHFASLAQLLSAGAGPVGYASLIFDDLGTGPDGHIGSVRIRFSTPFSFGAGAAATSGILFPMDTPHPE